MTYPPQRPTTPVAASLQPGDTGDVEPLGQKGKGKKRKGQGD
jgi:hypothetical protein